MPEYSFGYPIHQGYRVEQTLSFDLLFFPPAPLQKGIPGGRIAIRRSKDGPATPETNL
jgi:hypothetical protein